MPKKPIKYSNTVRHSLRLHPGPPPIVWHQGQNIDFLRGCQYNELKVDYYKEYSSAYEDVDLIKGG